ncbi:cytochrome P450 monooxygenase-like protein [Lasiosphaeria ovina]|uniref:Cytochrome P450 monooxygenase-like protein n=1 Tax=Lasiosphaeria ovina TaxID=92902 RepID=A0AAE0KM56_9PEZI|nr:cytochrome P450 monooxygenase-like protein [Lasiosphaeria ovina]
MDDIKLTTAEVVISANETTTPFPYALPGHKQLMGIFVGAYVVYCIISAVYLVFFHPLSKFPGPKLWAISRIPWAYYVIRGDLWAVLDELHQKYGGSVRIAPDEVTTIKPGAWKDIYVAKPVLAKDPYSLTPPLNGAHSLFTAEGDTHRRLRGALVNGFADKALRDQAPIVEGYADQLIARLRRDAAKSKTADGSGGGQVINIQRIFGYATFDTVTDLSFGESLLNTLERDTDNDEIRAFFLHAKFSTIRNCLSRFSPLDVLLGLFLLGATRATRERNWRLTTAKIERRLARGDLTGVRSDLLTPLVGKLDDNNAALKGTISRKELTTNQLAFVIADCQLTTVALATATYLLLRDPPKWRLLADEVRARFERDDQITVQATTQTLPYLEAVINETMRFRHPTPISLPRCIPPGGRTVDGQHIPGNTIIGINLQNIQTTPTLWADPHEFHPERFLPASDPRYSRRFDGDVKEAFMPFSAGPRNCLGSKVYLAQARTFLAKVVWNFDLAMPDPQHDWLDQKAYLVFEPKPLFVELSEPKRELRV